MDYSDEQFIRAWKELPDKERLMLYLIDVVQLSWEKVASIMGIQVVIAKNRTDWAQAALERKLLSYFRMGDLPEKTREWRTRRKM